MERHIKGRIRELGQSLMEHLGKALRREEAPTDALRQVAESARHNFKRIREGEVSRERKKAKKYMKEGVSAYNSGLYDRARQGFDKALEIDETYALAWAYLGNSQYKLGRLTEAIQSWQKATEAEPDSKGAEMAKEKLLRLGQGQDGMFDAIREQMRHR